MYLCIYILHCNSNIQHKCINIYIFSLNKITMCYKACFVWLSSLVLHPDAPMISQSDKLRYWVSPTLVGDLFICIAICLVNSLKEWMIFEMFSKAVCWLLKFCVFFLNHQDTGFVFLRSISSQIFIKLYTEFLLEDFHRIHAKWFFKIAWNSSEI